MMPTADKLGRRQFSCFQDIFKWLCFLLQLITHKGFAKWCEKDDTEPDAKCVYLASTNHRVVPLSHYGFLTTTEAVYKTIRDKETQKEIRDNTNQLIPLQDANGTYSMRSMQKKSQK